MKRTLTTMLMLLTFGLATCTAACSDSSKCDGDDTTDTALTGCQADDKHYAFGESWPASDGCNTHTCEADGGVSITDQNCQAFASCLYGEEYHALGTLFPAADGCNTCSCEFGREVVCTKKACAVTCEFSGNRYEVGDKVLQPLSISCDSLCTCQADGTWAFGPAECGT